MNAARTPWSTSWSANGVPMAAIGSMSTMRPASRAKPVGAFIHALAMMTKTAEAVPDAATTAPQAMCTRGPSFSQP